MVSDCFLAYDPLNVTKSKCAAHLLKQGFTLAAISGDLHTMAVGMAQRLSDLRR